MNSAAALLLWVELSLVAHASDPDHLLREVRAAQRAGEATAEVTLCVEAQEQHPDHRVARICEGRLAGLEPRRDPDGSFSGLERLRVVQQSSDAPDSRAAAAMALAEDPSVAVPVRHDARIWLARYLLFDVDDSSGALAWSAPLWAAWQAGELLEDQADIAADVHARALARSGDLAGARAVEAARKPIRSSKPAEGLAAELTRQRQRRRLDASWTGLVLFGGVGLPAAALAWRRKGWARPVGLGPLLVTLVATTAYVALWDAQLVTLFLQLGAWALAAHWLTSQASGVGGNMGRVVAGLLGAWGALAGGYLILDFHGQVGLLG